CSIPAPPREVDRSTRIDSICSSGDRSRPSESIASWQQVCSSLSVSRRTIVQHLQRLTPCLWFDDQAKEAAEFYTGIFKNSRIVTTTHYGDAGREVHGKQPGAVMTVGFELDGQPFTALNGGPLFEFNEAVSFQVNCETQDEVNYYWDKLSAGGDEKAQQC